MKENNKKVYKFNNVHLNNYDSKSRKYISMNERNVIVYDVKHLEYLVKEAFCTTNNKALHLGIINKDVIGKIRNNISNLPLNRKNYLSDNCYDLVINQSEIRHLLKNKSKLTRKDALNYVKLLPLIIINCNYVSYTKEKDEGLRFKALIDNNVYISFVLVSNKKRTLTAKSIFMEKKDFETKKETSL